MIKKLATTTPTVRPAAPSDPEAVAVIGLGALFPGDEPGVAGYWRVIRQGRDAITEIPEDRFRIEDYYDPDPKARDKTYSRRGAFIPKTAFAPLKWGITPKDMEATDTTQLLGLVVADEALADAGYPADRHDHSRTSVILGVTGAMKMVVTMGSRLVHPILGRAMADSGVDPAVAAEVLERLSESLPPWRESSFPGLLGNVTAGRLANRLNLGGSNLVVDAACASSLAAIGQAILELRCGRADLVVTGGLDTFSDPFMFTCFSKTPALSPTGEVRSFDKAGDGTLLGEGLGILVLKRLIDARRDSDRVYAVIKSVGGSSDGRGTAVFAPSSQGQARALAAAYRETGWRPAEVELVEAHGTGTVVGDEVELAALGGHFRPEPGSAPAAPPESFDDESLWCALGSVKSQIGHAKAAAGAAGLIKAVLSLHHQVLPPTIKASDPLTPLASADSPFFLNDRLRPWLSRPGRPRRAGVSSFGFGGSNFHCLLEESGDPKKPIETDLILVAVSGDSLDDLAEPLAVLAPLAARGRAALEAGARSLYPSFKPKDPFRLAGFGTAAVIAKTLPEVTSALAALKAGRDVPMPAGFHLGRNLDPPRVVLRAGPSMAAERDPLDPDWFFPALALSFPVYQSVLDRAEGVRYRLRLAPFNLGRLIDPPALAPAAAKERWLRSRSEPAVSALTMAATELAQGELLRSFGLKASSMRGSGLGLVTVTALSGLINADQAMSSAAAFAAGDPGASEALGAVLGRRTFPAVCTPHGPVKTAPQLLRAIEESLADAAKAPDDDSAAGEGSRGVCRSGPGDTTIFLGRRPAAADSGSIHLDPKSPVESLAGVLTRLLATGAGIDPARWPKGSEAREAPEGHHLMVGGANVFTPAERRPPNQAAVSLTDIAGLQAESLRLLKTLAERLEGSPASSAQTPGSAWPAAPAAPAPSRPAGAPASPAFPASTASHGLNALHGSNASHGLNALHGPAAPHSPAASHGPAAAASLAAPHGQAAPLSLNAPHGQAAPLSLNAAHGPAAETSRLSGKGNGGKGNGGYHGEDVPTQAAGQAALAALPDQDGPIGPEAWDTVAAVVSRETGYPPESLQPSLTLEGDLGLDSIKRVELLSALSEVFPSLASAGSELGLSPDLGRLAKICSSAARAGAACSSAPGASAGFASGGFASPQGGSTAFEGAAISSEGDLAMTAVAPPDPAIALARHGLVLEVLSQETGYPVETLSPELSLDADLGLDSIKRVELLSALSERLDSAPSPALGEAETIGELLKAMDTGPSSPAQAGYDAHSSYGAPAQAGQGAAALAGRDVAGVASAAAAGAPAFEPRPVREIVAAETGYPIDTLTPELDLENDLGLDSIKRVEILSLVSEGRGALTSQDQSRLSEARRLGDWEAFFDSPGAARASAITLASGESASYQNAAGSLASGEPAPCQNAAGSLASGEAASHQRAAISLAANPSAAGDTAAAGAPAAQAPAAQASGALWPETAGDRPSQSSLRPFTAGVLDHLPYTPGATDRAPYPPLADGHAGSHRRGAFPSGRELLDKALYGGSPPQQPTLWRVEPEPFSPDGHGACLWPPSGLVRLVGSDALTKGLENELKASGYEVERKPWSHDFDRWRDDGLKPRVLFLVWPGPDRNPNLITQALKALESAGDQLESIVGLSFLGGNFGFPRPGGVPHRLGNSISGALVGLLKCAAREWPGVSIRALDIPMAIYEHPVKSWLSAILETAAAPGPVELGLPVCDRPYGLSLKPYQPAETAEPILSPGDTVVVTGGGRGVTAVTLLELAKLYKPRLVILGRTPLPPPEPDWLSGLKTDREIKAALHRLAGGTRPPRDLEAGSRLILSSRELRDNLAALEAAGSKVEYLSGDFTKPLVIESVARQIRYRFGPIKGLIHGAGVLADHPIKGKSQSDFARVYATKTLLAQLLLEAFQPEPLRLLVFFSSSTARFGRTGQADYAAGNEVLNKTAWEMAMLHPQCRVLALNWGPWAGGMVDGSLADQFRSQGVGLIGLKEGAETFLRLIKSPAGDPAEIIVLGPGTNLESLGGTARRDPARW